MGGKIFSEPKGNQPPIQTPRMNEVVYARTKNICVQQLQHSFEFVVVPAEAPGKIDHGDVDFLVQGPRPGFTWEGVGTLLKAYRMAKNGEARSFAVPIPYYNENNKGDNTYAQIDVQICSPGFMEWECLLASYGDMWQIIGKFLRPLGLTATNTGLHLRVLEIEPHNRAYSMIYLSHNVTGVLDFLGLDIDQYQRGFKSFGEVYSWCASGKYFHLDAVNPKDEKANDRQRMKKRAMFRNFIDGWIPQNAHLWKDKEPVKREDVVQHALVFFGKQAEYERKITQWRLQREEEQLWAEVAGVISEECSKDVNIVVRGLKRWVRFTNDRDNDEQGQPALRAEAEMDPDHQPRWTSRVSHEGDRHTIPKCDLLEWVRKFWPDVKDLEKRRVAVAKTKQ